MDQQPIDTTSSDQQQALADQNSVQPKNVFSYTSDNMIKEGDTVIIWESADSIKQIQMKRGSTFQNKHGAFPHGDIIDKVEYGTKVFSKSMMGWMHILRPNSHIYTTSLAQRTQILYTPDISQVLFKLELQPGYRVAESGTGSGSLSLLEIFQITKIYIQTDYVLNKYNQYSLKLQFLLYDNLQLTLYPIFYSIQVLFQVPTGHLFTYEFNQVRAEKAKEDFQRLGFYPNNVHVTHRDVLNNGFLLNDDQTQEVLVAPGSIDAIFLDLPSPERAVPHAYQVLRKGGKLCNFSPCIEQVQKAVTEMARQGFYEIRTYETLTREYTVNKYEYESLNKVKKDVQEEEDQSKQQLNKRTQKQKDKNMIVTAPRIDQRGHTVLKLAKCFQKQFLNSLKKKGKQNDVDFFTSLEQKDMDSRLIEIIMFEVNKMFAKEMAKYRNVTSEFNTMLKRKNLLEAKLFKKRYEKVQKHLNGIPNMESTLNPFKRQYQPSIFNESLVDSKMDIPNNKELYENVIKEAFGDLADPDEDADQEQLKQMSDKEIIERIRMKYRRRVLKEGPSILNQPDKPSRFLEQMMKLCNFQRISNKIQGGMNKYQRSLRLKHKSFSVNPQSPPELEKDEDDDNNKSSFFITQAFMPLPSVEITTPTLKLGNQSLRTPVKSNHIFKSNFIYIKVAQISQIT